MSVFNTDMVMNAVESEYGHTFVHWKDEFRRWLEGEAIKMVREYEGGDGEDKWSPYD